MGTILIKDYMKLVDVKTHIDDNTYDPVHTIAIEITEESLRDMEFIERIFGPREVEHILGMRMREILDEVRNYEKPA